MPEYKFINGFTYELIIRSPIHGWAQVLFQKTPIVDGVQVVDPKYNNLCMYILQDSYKRFIEYMYSQGVLIKGYVVKKIFFERKDQVHELVVVLSGEYVK